MSNQTTKYCNNSSYSSRVCELGTKGCSVNHFKFKIGATVEITDKGKIYDMYEIMADEMKLHQFETGWIGFGSDVKLEEGVIVSRKMHPHDIPIYGIRLKGHNKDVIVSEDGLKLMVLAHVLPDELFEL